MPITPLPGWMIDPNNRNGVVQIPGYKPPVSSEPPPRNDTPYGSMDPDIATYEPTTPIPGETPQQTAARIAEKPFALAGGRSGGGGAAAEVASKATLSSTNARINRPVFSQNDVGGASTTGGGSDGIDDRTDAEKERDTYLSTQPKPQTEEEILAKKTEQAKGRIKANEDYYASFLGDQQRTNQLRERETNAQLVMKGLAGSSEAGTKTFETLDRNNADNKKILAAKAVELSNIYADIQDSVDEELKKQKEDYVGSLDKRVEISQEHAKKASDNITLLAKSGFDFDSIKKSDPATYNHLAQSVGGEEKLKAYAVLNRPAETIEDKRVENGKYIIAYKNPLTGKVRVEQVDLGLPDEYDQHVDLGDRQMFYPKGKPEKAIFIAKGISPKTSTQADEKTAVIDQYTNAFAPGIKLKDGTPTLAPDGSATFKAWKEAIKEAPTKGITRTDFIKTFGHLLVLQNDKIPKEYGLTPAEERLVLTAKTADEELANPFGLEQ